MALAPLAIGLSSWDRDLQELLLAYDFTLKAMEAASRVGSEKVKALVMKRNSIMKDMIKTDKTKTVEKKLNFL